MKKFLLSLLISLPLFAQTTTEPLTLDWSATVNYGSFGQRTVLVNDTLWHFGGRFFYGTPFGVQFWEQSFIEFRALSDSYWSEIATTSLYRFYGNAHVYNDQIYLLGGGGSDPTAVELFDPRTQTISLLEPMPARHSNAGSAIYDGKIYMIAGSDEVGNSDRVDIYDIATNTWSVGTSHPIAAQTEAVVHNGMIYTMGGFDGTVRDEIYGYDIANDTWTQIGTMPYPTSAHKLEVFNDYIYVVSDYADVDRLMRYSITDGSWIEYESNFIGRRHCSTAIADNKLYIIAGNSNKDGFWQYYNISQSIDLSDVVSVASNQAVLPTQVELKQNFPNPFNPTTSIRFFLDRTSDVELTIHNLKGQQVRDLQSARMALGEYEIIWDGRNDSGKALASGQYMYTLKAGGQVLTRSMVLLR